jgi:hypothetical protein
MAIRQGKPTRPASRTSKQALPTVQFALFLFVLVLLAAGCASPGEPMERKPPVPQAIGDLAGAQIGNSVVLTFTLPKETVDHLPLDHLPSVEIFRDFVPAAGTPPVPPTLHATIPSAVMDSYTEQDRIRYTDSFQPEDFSQQRDMEVLYSIRTRASLKKDSANSNFITLRIHPSPDAVDDLKAEVTHSGIQLSWTAPSKTPIGVAPSIGTYRIYRVLSQSSAGQPDQGPAGPGSQPRASDRAGTKTSSPPLKIGESANTSYLDTQFELGQRYVYIVRSVVEYGADQIESADSNLFDVLARDVTPPAAPQRLIVVYVPAEENVPPHLELSWSISPETDLAGYNVYRSEQAGMAGTRENTELLLTPAFRDMNAETGHSYLYVVSAVDRSGNESSVSAAATGSVPAESK